MVDDDVAESADGVVEVAAILDAEVLGHRDLHRGDEVAVPHGLEQRVREAQVDDLLGAHLPEVVVDAQELALVDVLVQLLARGLEPSPGRGRTASPRPRERSSSGPPRQGPERPCRTGTAGSRGRRPAYSRPRSPRPPERTWPGPRSRRRRTRTGRKSLEDVFVELLARTDDRLARALDELLHGPVVDGDADDRAVEQPPQLEPIQRAERHHLREIAGDPEDDEDIGRPRISTRLRDACLWSLCRAHASTSLCVVESDATGWSRRALPSVPRSTHPRRR